MSSKVAVHISPHPDDEAIGAPVTLRRLLQHDWHVVDINVSKGRPEDHTVRTQEWHDSLERAGIEGISLEPTVPTSSTDDLVAAERRISTELHEHFERLQPQIVISPHSQDVHHGHEVVARGVKRAVESTSRPPAWWAWGLWAELSAPNIYVPFDAEDLQRSMAVLRAYKSQLNRIDFCRLLEGNAMARAVRGTELVFGTGVPPKSGLPYAELLMEVTYDGSNWRWSPGRLIDFRIPLAVETGPLANAVLDRRSTRSELTGELR